jgi:hypothetical protein
VCFCLFFQVSPDGPMEIHCMHLTHCPQFLVSVTTRSQSQSHYDLQDCCWFVIL